MVGSRALVEENGPCLLYDKLMIRPALIKKLLVS